MVSIVKDIKNAFTKEKDILFLHGYLSSGNSFYRQVDFLSRDFNLYMPDLKGFGENQNMPYPYALDDYIVEVQEYMYKRGIKNPHIVAHSFGARIAIKLASQNPNIFNKMVLTGAAGLKRRFSLSTGLKKRTFKFLRLFVSKEKLQKFYSLDYQNLSPIMKQSFIKIVNEYLDDKLTLIKNQTLILHGKRDKETPLYMAKRLNKKIVNSKLIVLKDAGHFAFIDRPHKFNTEVKEFFLSKGAT